MGAPVLAMQGLRSEALCAILEVLSPTPVEVASAERAAPPAAGVQREQTPSGSLAEEQVHIQAIRGTSMAATWPTLDLVPAQLRTRAGLVSLLYLYKLISKLIYFSIFQLEVVHLAPPAQEMLKEPTEEVEEVEMQALETQAQRREAAC